MDYPPIPGTSAFAPATRDIDVDILVHDDGALPSALTSPPLPRRGAKSIFLFWHAGINALPPYLRRNVLALHQRYSGLGWTVYVIDSLHDSPLHVSRFIDVASPSVAPAALGRNTLSGRYALQHTSDLVRFPLLLRYGGVYMDVGILQFGDLDSLWEDHVGNPDSPCDYAGFTMGSPPDAISIVNFFMMCTPDNPLILRAHKIFLKLWEGKTDTTGTHSHPLVSHVPLMRVPSDVTVTGEGEQKMDIDDESMTDYAIQIQALGAAQRWLDERDGWNGPAYIRNKCWLLSMVDQAYASEQASGWSSQRQLSLFSLKLPARGERESPDQQLARQIVEESFAHSWCQKLAHGFSARLFGAPTLGMLWRAHAGSDCAEGTYGGWLRWAQTHLRQDERPAPLLMPPYEPTMVASLEEMLDARS